ncbi:MAG: hypothetical protein ACRDUY_01830 [Nitriliruptorales bacterium]
MRIVAVAVGGTLAALAVLAAADGTAELLLFELLVLGLAVGAVRALLPLEAAPSSRQRPRPPDDGPADPGLARLERQVLFASQTASDAETRLRPRLRELAADRLRRRHGIDFDAEPDAAMSALGEPAWSYLRPDRPPSPDRFAPGLDLGELDAVLARIEAL